MEKYVHPNSYRHETLIIDGLIIVMAVVSLVTLNAMTVAFTAGTLIGNRIFLIQQAWAKRPCECPRCKGWVS